MTAAPLSPVDALRVIRAILRDRSLSHAVRGVLIALAIRADNQTGQAWADYPSLHREFDYSTDTISAAIKAGLGKYIVEGPRGRHGAQSYYVPPLPSAGSCERTQLSGQAGAALCSSGPSAPSSGDKLAQELAHTTGPKGPPKRAQGQRKTARDHVDERRRERTQWEAEEC